jgi:hypothetical protein
MLPKFYQTHFQRQLSRSQFLVLEIVLNLLGSEKQVRLERLARVFPYPITTLKSSSQATKISGFTPAHPNLFVVSPNYLLVDNLLPCGTEVIASDRPQSMGSYQSVYDQSDLGEESNSLILVIVTKTRKQ